jgi:hypothetical protein
MPPSPGGITVMIHFGPWRSFSLNSSVPISFMDLQRGSM